MRSIILEQALDVVELELRAPGLAVAAAQLVEDAARTLHIGLERHLDGRIVEVAAAQRPAERIGLLVGARLALPARLSGPLVLPHLLLQLLSEVLRALAHLVERTALAIDRAVGVALAERALRIGHGVARLAELVALALLTLLARLLAKTLLLELLHQLAEPVAQRLLVLLQVAVAPLALLSLLALLPLLALLTLLALLALLPTLAALLAALVLAFLERLVAQLLLLADHVAKLVERRHHVVVIVAVLAGLPHLQVAQEIVELLHQIVALLLLLGEAFLQLADGAFLRVQPTLPIGILERIARRSHRRLGRDAVVRGRGGAAHTGRPGEGDGEAE